MSTAARTIPSNDSLSACVSCQAVFPMDSQKTHYQSEWHRYNLKRRVAALPPIGLKVFEEKVAQRLQEEADQKRQSEATDTSKQCTACGKKFQSAETFSQHCQSKKHKENEKRAAEMPKEVKPPKSPSKPSQQTLESAETNAAIIEDENDANWSDVSSEGSATETDLWGGDLSNAIHIDQCLFCGDTSHDSEANLKHMYVSHGFFVPDVEYCVDADGLLQYLGEKVGCGRFCIYCLPSKKRRFADLNAVRHHMQDLAHCKLRRDAESMLELADFYDYSSSYPDATETDPESDAQVDVMLERNWQLVLPSGAALGHRSLARYFRQRLRPDSDSDRRRRAVQRAGKVNALLAQYRAIGWTQGGDKELVASKARDMAFMRKALAKRQHLIDGPKGSKSFVFTGRSG